MSGLAWVLAAELFACGCGFLVLVLLARRLGPLWFGRLEFAAAVTAWMLVLVRGGVDVIVYREAARRPRLIGSLTNLLIALRLLAACAGYAIVLGLAAVSGGGRGLLVAAAGLLLFPAALTTDVAARAEGRLGWVALAVAARGAAWLALVATLVRGAENVAAAALCTVAAEAFSAAVSLFDHWRTWGPPRPNFRRRAIHVLASRGLIVGLIRLGRVTVYAADLLILGEWAVPELGSCAAARRIVYALVGLGLVVPSALGPLLARAWTRGLEPARLLVHRSLGILLAVALPSALGLALVADRLMPALFGSAYRDGGPWLGLVAARLPWLLAGSFAQAALIAFRRERESLWLVLVMLAAASVFYPMALAVGGAWGAGWASLGVELIGACTGTAALGRLGVEPDWKATLGRIFPAGLGLVIACHVCRSAPLTVQCLAGALTYGLLWSVLKPRPFPGGLSA
jgi:O-antigen/teichoic acid export membrane protein